MFVCPSPTPAQKPCLCMCLSPLPYSGPKPCVCLFVRPFAPLPHTLAFKGGNHVSVHFSVPLIFDAFTIGLYFARDNFRKYFHILQKEIQQPNQLNSTEYILDILTIGVYVAYGHFRTFWSLGHSQCRKVPSARNHPRTLDGPQGSQRRNPFCQKNLHFVKIIFLSSWASTWL